MTKFVTVIPLEKTRPSIVVLQIYIPVNMFNKHDVVKFNHYQ